MGEYKPFRFIGKNGQFKPLTIPISDQNIKDKRTALNLLNIPVFNRLDGMNRSGDFVHFNSPEF